LTAGKGRCALREGRFARGRGRFASGKGRFGSIDGRWASAMGRLAFRKGRCTFGKERSISGVRRFTLGWCRRGFRAESIGEEGVPARGEAWHSSSKWGRVAKRSPRTRAQQPHLARIAVRLSLRRADGSIYLCRLLLRSLCPRAGCLRSRWCSAWVRRLSPR
jgi:hypothetical protein